VLGTEERPGLWVWSGSYPDWKHPVRSCALRTPGELILIDPLLEDRQWEGLGRLAGERQVHVVLTIHWHARSAAAVAERFAAVRVWANSRNRAAIARRVEPTDLFAAGDELPGGLVPFAARPRSEVVLWDPAHHALIAGDALVSGDGRVVGDTRAGDGRAGEARDGGDPARSAGNRSVALRLSPASWLPQSTGHDDLRAALRSLLDLPVELILVSHGAPITTNASAELRRVIAG
jgi:glyoxylase-like metal-dependent hydrolase (beta-lactamase superfamily II)